MTNKKDDANEQPTSTPPVGLRMVDNLDPDELPLSRREQPLEDDPDFEADLAALEQAGARRPPTGCKPVLHEIRDNLAEISSKLDGDGASADDERGQDAVVPTTQASTEHEAEPEPKPEPESMQVPKPLTTKDAALLLRVRKHDLDLIAKRELAAKRALPAQQIGKGGQRVHLRWDPERLHDWWAEVDKD